jgi:Fe-S oxidoreductase
LGPDDERQDQGENAGEREHGIQPLRDGIGYHGVRDRTTPLPRRRIRKEEAPNLRVALFITCFNDTLFPETGKATVEVLERLGIEVDFPLDQTC